MRSWKKFLAVGLSTFSLLSAEPADSIFFGGDIVTMNDKQPTAEAVAVEGGKIVFVGALSEAQKLKGPNTTMVDLHGHTLLPGFIDPHTHLLFRGISEKFLDVSPFTFDDIDDIKEALKQAATKGPVIAFGYDPSLMTQPGNLGFDELDAISNKVPILVINLSGHIAYGNRKAFAQAGVSEGSENPKGGSFQRNKDERLTGRAYEYPAVMKLVSGFKDLKLDYAAIAKKTAKEYAKHGFTTITDLGLGMDIPSSRENIEILRTVANAPDAPIRIQGYAIYSLVDQVPELKKENNPRFQILGVKIWADGSVQGYTAALRERYKGRNTRGTLNYEQADLNAMVLKAHQKDLQIAIHANGDKAVESVLEAFEKAQKAYPRPDPRFRVEHATVTDEKLLKRMAEAKATPSFTNQHVYYWGKVFKRTILGEKRAEHIDGARTARDLGMVYSFNDDAPTTNADPLIMIEVGATRKMLDNNILNPKETITVNESIKALTIYPAWQTFRENEIGSIEVGKYADFVELSQNPAKVPPTRIREIEVLGTWIDGKKVLID